MTKRIYTVLVAVALAACLLLQTGCTQTPEPADVAVSAEADERAILLRWNTVEGSDLYRIFRKAKEDNDFKFVCDVTDGDSYTDTYAVQGREYIYKIKAYGGSALLGEGVCSPTDLLAPPQIIAIRQVKGNVYEVEWDHKTEECVVFGKSDAGWLEIGRSNNGLLQFENTKNCTQLAVSSSAKDAVRSDSVIFGTAGAIVAATALDGWTNVIEVNAPAGDWLFELARAETKNGAYTVIGSADNKTLYDHKTAENETPYWYRIRCKGERFESAWSEPVQLGKNARSVSYVPVMMYHDFMPQEEIDKGVEFADDVITPEEFESDLLWLKKNGYSTVTTAAIVDYLESGAALPEKPVILTIDDGKYGVYKWAWPLLKKYGMTGTLSVIGTSIDEATQDPQARQDALAPFCTWDEIKAMHASGAMEIISHTYSLHVYSHDGRHGADCAPDETAEQYLPVAAADYKLISERLQQVTGAATSALAYPYSIRSSESDRMWLAAGYKMLLCGNNDTVHHSKWNAMIRAEGINAYSSLLRRISRMPGTSIEHYLSSYEDFLTENGVGAEKKG